MAGDWIKMRTDLAEDPDVIALAAATGLEEDLIVGKLHKLWCWADRQTVDGNAHSVTTAFLDRYLGVPGFSKALQAVGWLAVMTDGIIFPNFERHNGQVAKRKALGARRQARYKHKLKSKGDAVSVTRASPLASPERQQGDADSVTVPLPSSSPPGSPSLSPPTPPSITPPPIPSSSSLTSFCSEPERPASEPPILSFPCVGTGPKEWHLTASKLAEYREAFPGIDALAECRKALQWCRDNPAKRKTARGMARFLGTWLGKAQDSRATTSGQPQTLQDFARQIEAQRKGNACPSSTPSANGRHGTAPSSR